MRPIYLIRDPELAKQITTKDFESFENHKFVIDPKLDSLIGNTIFAMSGQKWRDMRTTMSPAFTGSKMRHMFELIRECAVESANHFISKNPKESHCLEMREYVARYANDVIASCAFGLQINSHVDRTNKFYLTGRRFQHLSSAKAFLKILLQRSVPWLLQILGIEFIDADIRVFFSDMVLWNIEERRMKGINRPDIIDLLMHERKGPSSINVSETTTNGRFNWSDKEIIANCFIFFLAGFDTSTWFLTAATYQLALHENVQKRLIEEIDDLKRTLNGREISYDDLKAMKYLDMVVSEVLRINPPNVYIDRVCTKDYLLNDGDLNVFIEKGTEFWIPIYNYHHDPEYFPNPSVFDPERFSEANRSRMNAAHYIPFGSGPRACIGSRFALMEVKALLYFVLLKFNIRATSETEIPMKLISSAFGVQPVNGVNLELTPR